MTKNGDQANGATRQSCTPRFATVKGINRTNDYAFKRILGGEEGKEALLGFLNAVLKPPPGRELTKVELLDRELDPEYLLDRGARLDVLARTVQGALINIEVQVPTGTTSTGEAMEAIAVENPAIKKALTIEEAFWRSERERRLYELREKALRDEIVMMDGARAEGKAEGKAEMAQEAICRYLEVRFGEEVPLGLREKVKKCTNLDMLDKIMNKIYTASSLEDARAIIEGVPGA